MDFESGLNNSGTIHNRKLLILKVLLVFILVVVVGYVAYLKGQQDGNSQSSVAMQKTQKNTDDYAQKSDDEDKQNPASFEMGDMKVIANDEQTFFEVWYFGKKLGEIKSEGPIAVDVWRESGPDIYLGVTPDGLGGYYLFGGPQEVYRVDGTSLTKVYSGKGKDSAYASDMFLPNKLFAVESTIVDGQFHTSVVVYDIDSQKSQSYPVPAPYKTAGGHFSQGGSKIIYETAIGNPDAEESAIFVIDLTTGKQEQIGGSEKWN